MRDLQKMLLIKEVNQCQTMTNYTLVSLRILKKEFLPFIHSKINIY